MELAIGLVIGFIIGSLLDFYILNALMSRAIDKMEEQMEKFE